MNDDRPLLVFFWSERSGPARRMESLLAHLERKERDRLRVRSASTSTPVPSSPSASGSTSCPRSSSSRTRRAVSRLDGRTSAPKIEAMLEPHLRQLAAA